MHVEPTPAVARRGRTESENVRTGILIVSSEYGLPWPIRSIGEMIGARTYPTAYVDITADARALPGRPTSGPEEQAAFARINAISDIDVTARINDQVSYLAQRGCGRIAVVAFGYGATIALDGAMTERAGKPLFNALLAFYPFLGPFEGITQRQLPLPGQIKCPVRIIYGENDRITMPSSIRAGALSAQDMAQVRLCNGVGYGFAEPGGRQWVKLRSLVGALRARSIVRKWLEQLEDIERGRLRAQDQPGK